MTDDERNLVDALIAAQTKQGDSDALQPTPYKVKEGTAPADELPAKVKNLKRGYSRVPKEVIEKDLLLGHEHNTASAKRKRLRLSQVSAETRVRIAKLIATKQRTHREIADLFNIRISAI